VTHSKLPIGIQDFESIICDGYTYVDKTQLIYQLITQGKPYFLSRPRRFGKSLLISTLHALFSGKRSLFKWLWIDQSNWDWAVHPIIRLDMSTINNDSPEMLERALIHALNEIGSSYGLTLSGETSSDYLYGLIKQLVLATGQKVVVLIDEYDRAIIDNIDDLDLAKKNREVLRKFYTILKAQDEYLRFIFLTGVTNFSKVSVFSGLNNLNDLTMQANYSTLLGYTRDELKRYFSKDIELLGLQKEECDDQIKAWYNGYKFSQHGELVYNPFSVLNLLNSREFKAHWFETGTPTFLIKLIQKREFDLINLEQYEIAAEDFNTFEIEDLPTLPLLYQTGYLTIKFFDPAINSYRLGYPNREVSQAFTASILKFFATSKARAADHLTRLCRNISTTPWDYAPFFAILSELLALLPYDLYLKHEKHYQSLFYLIIKLAGVSVSAEVHTQRGRVDAAIEMSDKIILFEFKLDKSAAAAIDQMKEKKYYEMYADRNTPIFLAGLNFNSQIRTMDDWCVEKIPQW
jgi:hypothetical protein